MEIVIPSLDALPNAVNIFFKNIGTAKKIALYGEIGVGKTTFIKAICQQLQVRENVASPTFSIINEYSYLDSSTNQDTLVYHCDLYRLKSVEEALDIGIEDYLYDTNFCFVEWPNIIESILPSDCIKIKFEISPDSSRKILFL